MKQFINRRLLKVGVILLSLASSIFFVAVFTSLKAENNRLRELTAAHILNLEHMDEDIDDLYRRHPSIKWKW